MKVRISPAPSPYREANPDDIVITKVLSCWDRQGPFLEAWGYLRSEMQPKFHSDVYAGPSDYDHDTGPEYIIGHSNAAGTTWYQEGDLIGALLDVDLVRQIENVLP